MSKIAFVLLYYKSLDDTIECLESLKCLSEKNHSIEIVLVDNCSGDGSFDILKAKYMHRKNITFIVNSVNAGYAAGNNIGIRYAKEQLYADFVVVLNTDTVIRQENFCDELVDIYNREKFYVMGPNVLGYDNGLPQSPLLLHDETNVKKLRRNNRLHWFLWKTYLIFPIRKIRKPKTIDRKPPRSNEIYTCVCHGSCLIFSPLFLEKWNGFYSETFLYREESILFYILHTLNCKTVFTDRLTIFHKGGKSAEAEYGKQERKQRINFYRFSNQSIEKELCVRQMSPDQLSMLLK